MKEGNNIDQFFKKRLGSSSVKEEDWNIPSDDIWDAAKLHFPKEKKKRPFIFWFLGFGLIFATIVLWNSFNPTTNSISNKTTHTLSNKKHHTKTESTNNRTTKNNSEKLNSQQNNKTSSLSTAKNKLNTSASLSTNANKTSAKPVNQVAQPLPNASKRASLTTFDHNRKTTSSTNNRSIDVSRADLVNKVNNIENNHQSEHLPTNSSIKAKNVIPTLSATNIEEHPAAQVDDKNNIEKKEDDKTSATEDLNTIKINQSNHNFTGISAVGLSKLPSLSITQQENKIPNLILPKTKLLTVIKKRPIYKWEVGISHAPFILNPFKLAERELKNDDDIALKSTYQNINLHIRRRLGDRFSLSSGISYSALKDINLSFDFRDAYDAGNLKDQVSRHASIGSLQINDAQTDFNVSFIPSANVMDGDTLQIIGEIDAQIKAIQIPFILNYHIRRGKWDWMLHAGPSLDLLTAQIQDVDLELYKEGIRASNPFDFTSVQDSGIGLSIIAGGGVKYHIGEHFNFGLSAKFDLGGIIFSRYDIGVYYGF